MADKAPCSQWNPLGPFSVLHIRIFVWILDIVAINGWHVCQVSDIILVISEMINTFSLPKCIRTSSYSRDHMFTIYWETCLDFKLILRSKVLILPSRGDGFNCKINVLQLLYKYNYNYYKFTWDPISANPIW